MMSKTFFSKLFFSLLFFSLLCSGSFAQTERTEADIKTIMKDLEVVGISVAVVKKNKIVYSHAFGLANIEANMPLSTDNLFRIASISKSFSATSIMQLVEAGKVSLDADFSDLVGFKVRNPNFPETPITLRMVMSHTSSVNDSQGYFNFDVIKPETNPDWAKCYNQYEPGKGYEYCNLNYNMVGAVIERLSGERFDMYVRHHVLEPLNLYGGYCVDSLDATRFATLYEYDSSTRKFTPSPMAYTQRREELRNYIFGQSTPVFSPTGGMKISAIDLAKVMMMHMNQGKYNGVRIISKKSAKTMQTKIAEEEGYGLAISNLDDLIPGLTMTGHTGSAYGLYSAMFFNRKKNFGIVVITNGCNPIYINGINAVLRKTINALYSDVVLQ